MAAMLRDSTVVVVVVVVRTRPRAIPLAMIHMRKSIHGFPFVPLYGYGAPLGGLQPPSSAIMVKSYCVKQKKKTECVEPSGYKQAKNGRLMFFCTCAECGITKTKFVKSQSTGGIKKTTKRKTINNLN